jgi:hypothetical protein
LGPVDLLEAWAPALLADPVSAAPEGGLDLQALAAGLVASNGADSDQADLAQVDLDQVDLDQADLDVPVSFDRVGSVGPDADDSEFPAFIATSSPPIFS